MTLEGVAASVGDVPRTATLAAAKVIKRVAEIEAMRAVGPDRKFSNVRRGKLNTRDDFDFGKAQAEVTVYAVPPGLWSWVESGTAPHVIGFGRASRSRRTGVGNYRQAGRSGAKRLHIGQGKEGNRMGPVFHPGTSGKRAWSKVRKRSGPLVLKAFGKELHEAVSGG